MINWRGGKAGFVGGIKHNIKGFFRAVYAVTSTAPVDPVDPVDPPVVVPPTPFFTIYSSASKIQKFSSVTKISIESNVEPIKVL